MAELLNLPTEILSSIVDGASNLTRVMIAHTCTKFAKIVGAVPLTTDLCDEAAKTGNVLALEWLIEKNCPKTWYLCETAAEHGHLNVLKYMRRKNLNITPLTQCDAALKGHLHIIKWTHKYPEYTDEDSPVYAALGGHLECLKWFHKHGYFIDVARLCVIAGSKKYWRITKWLRSL